MKKLTILAVIIAALALPTLAQEASVNTPVARPAEAKHVVTDLHITAAQAWIIVSVRDASNNEVRQQRFDCPDDDHTGATPSALFQAIDTVRATETGTVLRRANFRILGFLVDQGYLSGVMLVP